MTVLREDLLAGRTIALAGPIRPDVRDALVRQGGSVEAFDTRSASDEEPTDGPHARAARDALENLARTLSVEWARYGITTTAIAPGAASTDQDVALLVAFLVSPAGGYFTGCRFELGAC